MEAAWATVERILRQQQDLLTGRRFSYDPQERRDPFLSLTETVRLDDGDKPRGIKGMVISEINLTGIVKDGRGGNMALMMGSDNKGYFLRVGDVVYDGTLIGIDSGIGTVTFRQKINDPRRIKPYQDIVKTLDQLEDEERTR